MATIGQLGVLLTGNAGGFNKTMAQGVRGVSGFVGTVSASLGGFAAIAAGALGVASAGALIGESLSAINEDEKASAKLGAVLQATGGAAGFTQGQLEGVATSLQQVTTYADETIVNAEAVLATFREVKGDSFTQATKAILDMSAVMGTDLQGSAVLVGKALNNPIKGISALQRVGVSFSDMQIDQIKNFTAMGNVAGAQGVILSELRGEFGGAAEAIAKTGGGMRQQAKNAFGDILEGIGAVINGLTAGFVPTITSTFGTVATFIRSNAASIASGIMNVVMPVVTVIGSAISSIYTVISSNWGTITSLVSSGVTSLVNFLVPIGAAIWGAIVGVVTAVGQAAWSGVQAIAAAFGWAADSAGGWAAIFEATKNAIVLGLIAIEFAANNWQTMVGGAVLSVAKAFVDLWDRAQWAFQNVVGFIGWAMATQSAMLDDGAAYALTVLNNLTGNIVAVFANLPGLIKGTVNWADVWKPLGEGFKASVYQLPEIAAVTQSDLSKQLGESITADTTTLGQNFETFAAQRLSDIDKARVSVMDLLKGGTGAAFQPPKTRTQNDTPEQPKMPEVNTTVKNAAESGRFALSGTGLVGGTPLEKLGKTAQRQLDVAQDIRTGVNKIATQEPLWIEEVDIGA